MTLGPWLTIKQNHTTRTESVCFPGNSTDYAKLPPETVSFRLLSRLTSLLFGFRRLPVDIFWITAPLVVGVCIFTVWITAPLVVGVCIFTVRL